jgi:periplasmic protein CpxP/Spy
MDIFAQRKLLISTVIALVIINLVSISFFVWKDYKNNKEGRIPNEPNPDKVKAILTKKLNLTEGQSKKMTALRLDFYGKEKVLSKIIRAERDSMNDIMFNSNTDDTIIKSLALNVSANEYKMEMLRYEQAKELKTICTPQQLQKFETLVKEIRDYFKPFNQNKKQSIN